MITIISLTLFLRWETSYVKLRVTARQEEHGIETGLMFTSLGWGDSFGNGVQANIEDQSH